MSHEDWFDEHGWILKDIPEECIESCSHQGACDNDVEYWQEKLQFEVPRQMAIDYLREFGAWTVEELNEKNDTELAQIVLWLACGDTKEIRYQDAKDGEEVEEYTWPGLVH